MTYIRQEFAYSFIGKAIARALQKTIYKDCRVHWIQQAISDWNFRSLR